MFIGAEFVHLTASCVCQCSGIGIVNAIEVVNAFPEDDGLLKFRQWVESPDPTILGRFDAKGGSSSRKRGSKAEGSIGCLNSNIEKPTSDQSISQAQEEKDSSDDTQETKQIFMDKHVMCLICGRIIWCLSHIQIGLIFSFMVSFTEKCEQELAYSILFSK